MIRARAHTRSRPSPPASVRLFGAVPDPPTRSLVDELRAAGTAVRALYRQAPADGADDPRPLVDDDVVTGPPPAPRREWREWIDTRDAHVLLAGSPGTALDMARRAATLRRTRTLHLWGGGSGPDRVVRRPMRHTYYGPWGLDGIFAVGSRSVASYRSMTGRDVPVHVLPRVTGRASAVPARPAMRPTIGYTGRLLPDRGLDLLLRALARLPASARPRLQVVGTGPELGPLQTRASRLGIDRWVDWLGEVDDCTLDFNQSRWWALIVPTQRQDRWSLTVQTALNGGVPVIASGHVRAAADLVRTGCNGTIVAEDDPDPWAAAIGDMTDPSVQHDRAAAARAVGHAFAPRNSAAWLLDLLESAERARRVDGRRLASRSFVDHAWSRLVPPELHPPAPG